MPRKGVLSNAMSKKTVTIVFVGIAIGALLEGMVLNIEKTQSIIETFQSVVLIIATIFTAWWTSKTFGFQQRNTEAREINTLLSKVQSSVDLLVSNNDLVEIYLISNSDPSKVLNYVNSKNNYERGCRMALAELGAVVGTHGTVKPYTRLLLQELSSRNLDSCLTDRGLKLRNDIFELQFRLINEANFDIGIEWIKLKRRLGF